MLTFVYFFHWFHNLLGLHFCRMIFHQFCMAFVFFMRFIWFRAVFQTCIGFISYHFPKRIAHHSHTAVTPVSHARLADCVYAVRIIVYVHTDMRESFWKFVPSVVLNSPPSPANVASLAMLPSIPGSSCVLASTRDPWSLAWSDPRCPSELCAHSAAHYGH